MKDKIWVRIDREESILRRSGKCGEGRKAGTLVEAFGAGTALTSIECINYNGEDLEIPATGEVTQRAWDELMDIQYGKIEHPWSYKIDESI